VVVGPSLLGIVEPDEVLEVFAELGVVFLLFWVGLETKVSELREVGSTALAVGVLGVVLPLAGGIGLGVARGDETATAIFLGAALVATSVGITSAVLIELGVLRTRVARTILGAAIVDDVLALIILSLAVGIAAEDGVDVGGVLVVLAIAVAFVGFFALGGTRLMRARPQILSAPRFAESPLLPAVLLCLGLAALSAQIGLAAIIGAFLAGLMVAETREQHPVEDEIAPLYAFFAPFFFAFIGTELDLDALADPGALALLAGVTAIAIATMFAGAYLVARSLGGRDATAVGVGMIPRGEVGIIVAGIGKAEGVIDAELFAVIVGMSIATTLVVPPLLRRLVSRPPDGAKAAV
jgi:Kef-type K+ transport system membrane component KefB